MNMNFRFFAFSFLMLLAACPKTAGRPVKTTASASTAKLAWRVSASKTTLATTALPTWSASTAKLVWG